MNLVEPNYVKMPKGIRLKIQKVNEMKDFSEKNLRRRKTVRQLLGKPNQKTWVNFQNLEQCLNSILKDGGGV